ncbi:hypothetical protein chiPu_0015135 [Chiloscyllium punctatum]|uniref:Microtubule-associated protein 1S n=2 Tax=Chiloscyllium punctatum TaxID=137246 RepID=A0A401T1Y0_CHIPU|nr:hypothetical protein [Chiloscyllium punctatum]
MAAAAALAASGSGQCKASALVVLGEAGRPELLLLPDVIAQIRRGILSWDIDASAYSLDEQLKLFVSRHSATFPTEAKDQKILHHCGEALETLVLINPSVESLCAEVRTLIAAPSRHKLLVLAGPCLEESGELLLQKGSFTLQDFIQIFTDKEIGELLSFTPPADKASLTLACPDLGEWKKSSLENHSLQEFIKIRLNPPVTLSEMEGLQEFLEYLSETMEASSPFDLLEPPVTVGFLKLSKPCCYIFPGGRGDSAFFAVNGFNILVDGGSDQKSSFWKLVRHLDRIDSVLLTHIGTDNLPGINSLLHRKLAELDDDQSLGSEMNNDWTKHLISPEIGVMFLNAPKKLQHIERSNVRRSVDEVSVMLQYLDQLHINPVPLYRTGGNSLEPLILFQKMGVGRLEMYILNPVEGSKDLSNLMQQWAGNGWPKGGNVPLQCLVSVCALIVWHPASRVEKIIRVLFPGCTPQNKILEGLEKVKHLDFLKQPLATLSELETLQKGKGPKPKRTESRESLHSLSKGSSGRGGRDPEAGSRLGSAKSRVERKDQSGKTKADTATLSEGMKESHPNMSAELKAREQGGDKLKTNTQLKPSKEKLQKKEAKPVKLEENKDVKVSKREERKDAEEKKQVRKEVPKQVKKIEPKKDERTGAKVPTKVSSVSSESRRPSAKSNMPSKEIKKDLVTSGKGSVKTKPKLQSKETADCKQTAGSVSLTEKGPQPAASKMSTPEDMTADFERLQQAEQEVQAQGAATGSAGYGGKVVVPDETSPDEGFTTMENESELESSPQDDGQLVDATLPENEDPVILELEPRKGGKSIEEKQEARGEAEAESDQGMIRINHINGLICDTENEDGFEMESPDKFRYFDEKLSPSRHMAALSPLAKTPRSDRSVNFDLTPTELGPLEEIKGQMSVNNQETLEDQCASSEEKTLEMVSPPGSGLASAGHTPFHQSPIDEIIPRGENGLIERVSSLLGEETRLNNAFNKPLDGGPQSNARPPFENTSAPLDRHTGFLTLSPFKEVVPDVSPTLTTPSLPAEVGSPHSTEVDESLSVSFEQVLPPLNEALASPREHNQRGPLNGLSPEHETFSAKGDPPSMSLPLKSLQDPFRTPQVALGSVSDGDGALTHGDGIDGRLPHVMALPSDSPHDVDLCLVSPCEFKHPKTELSPSFINPSPRELSDESDLSQEFAKPVGQRRGHKSPSNRKAALDERTPTSASESLPTLSGSDAQPGTEDCPSITADGGIDSEEDSEIIPADGSRSPVSSIPCDPLPAPMKDPHPPPPQPGICMVDPEVLTHNSTKDAREKAKGKKLGSKPALSSTARKTENTKQSTLSKPKGHQLMPKEVDKMVTGSKSNQPAKVFRANSNQSINSEEKKGRNLQTTSSKPPRSAVTGAVSKGPAVGPPVYVDLAYIPNNHSARTIDADFFKRLRSSIYVISGDDPQKEGAMRNILDALLEGKTVWGDNIQVTIIPTFDSPIMHEWYQETHEKQQSLNITVLGSNSTVVMQEETFPACKVEF